MKKPYLKLINAAALLLLLPSYLAFAQQPQAYTVALRAPGGNYVSIVAGGGLDASAKAITAKQIFTFIDLNGGTLVDGDNVKIQYETSLWHEEKETNRVRRVPVKGAKQEECIFKIRVKSKTILLETPSGKFVAVSNDGTAIETRDKREESSSFEAIPSQPPPPPPSPKNKPE